LFSKTFGADNFEGTQYALVALIEGYLVDVVDKATLLSPIGHISYIWSMIEVARVVIHLD